jgi:4-amino-4-deoxy-L-arabinose transferase-like glycosyltransferase
MNSLRTYYFIVEHLSVFIVFLAIAYVMGNRILARTSVHPESGRVFLSLSLGFGGISVLLFYAALFGFFYTSALVIFLVLSVIVLFRKREWVTLLTEFQHSSVKAIELYLKHWNWILPVVLLVAPTVFGYFLKCLYPPRHFDDIMYHLPHARDIVIHHGLYLNPYVRYPLFPQNFEMLYALLLLFYDDISSHIIHASSAVITAIGVYSLGALTSSRKTGVIGAIIFLSNPLVQILMKTAYIDLGLTMFVFLGFYCISLWIHTKKMNWLYLAGFATGMAAGTKYTALMYVLLYAVWIAYEGRNIRYVITFICLVIVFGSPWYIRNYILSGNPIFPFGESIFGYSWLWDRSDALGQSHDLLKAHGTPRTILSFLMLPWNLVMHQEKFMDDGGISLWMLAMFPSILFIKRFTTFQRKLCVFAFLTMIIWFCSTQILRYLLPLFPVMSLLSAYVLADLYDAIKKFFHGTFPAIKLICNKACYYAGKRVVSVVIIAVLLILQGKDLHRMIIRSSLPVTPELRSAYLSKHKPAHQLIQIANMDPSLNIYQLKFEDHVYYADGKIIGDHFGPSRYSTIYNVLGKSDTLYETLMAMDIQLFLLNKEALIDRKLDESFLKYFLLIAENDSGFLYGLQNNNKVMLLFNKAHGMQSKQKT